MSYRGGGGRLLRVAKGVVGRGRGRPPGPGVDYGARREDLLDAAEAVIAEWGDDFGMGAVGERAGFARSAVYAVFECRNDLLDQVAGRQVTRIRNGVVAAVVDVDDPREQTRSAISVLAWWIVNHEQLAATLAPRMCGGVGPGSIAGQIEDVLGRALIQVGGNPRAAAPWSHAVVGATWAAVQWRSDSGGVRVGELINQVTELIWEGIGGATDTSARVRLPVQDVLRGGGYREPAH